MPGSWGRDKVAIAVQAVLARRSATCRVFHRHSSSFRNLEVLAILADFRRISVKIDRSWNMRANSH